MQASKEFRLLADTKKTDRVQRYFKTGKGDYGEGDRFLGIMVPTIKNFAKKYKCLPLSDIETLLKSPFNEERLLALFILNAQYSSGDEKKKRLMYRFYMNHLDCINNWNLVDLSAPNIVGIHLVNRSRTPLYKLAGSKNMWRKRVAVLSTFTFIRLNEFDDALNIIKNLLNDKHDLIHKAAGWMLREIGKRDIKQLKMFLERNSNQMPRTMLRYAIEHFPEKQRLRYLNK